MHTNQDQQTPSGLPTLAEVERFMRHWWERLNALHPEAWTSFQVYHGGIGNSGISYFGNSGAGNSHGDTPEEMLERLRETTGPEAKAAKIAKLESELEEARKEVA